MNFLIIEKMIFLPFFYVLFTILPTITDCIDKTDRSDYNKIIHQYCFYPVLKEIEKKFWTEIDFHKDKIESCLYKIRNINWIVVDNDKYNSVYFPKKTFEKPCLEMSRYVYTEVLINAIQIHWNALNASSTIVYAAVKAQILCMVVIVRHVDVQIQSIKSLF